MMLTGQNGILIRAQEAGTNTAHAEVYETLNLESAEYMTESRIGEYGGSLIDYLLDEEYIKETDEEGKYLINVEKLLGTKGKYGNGTDGKNDVYKLEEEKQTSTIGKVATKELVKIGETETSKTYDVIYYEKEGKEGKLLGKLYDGDASATTTTTSKENLEDMYYLNGEYNGETGIIENIRLGFLPTMLEKIVEENMTEKDLLLRAAINIGYTTANTFEDYMEEIYTRSKTRYTTAKGFMMGYYNCSEEDYRYSDLISNLRNEYDKEENMTEEELILKWAVEECEITTASTFEEYMEEIYNQKKFTTPREYFKKYIGEVSVTYDDYISFLKFNVTYNELTIEDSNGNTIRRDPDYSIEGIGQYTFKIKLDNKILKTINVSIDQYEIIESFLPTSRLKMVLFPTFGRPTKETVGNFMVFSPFKSCSKYSIIFSFCKLNHLTHS